MKISECFEEKGFKPMIISVDSKRVDKIGFFEEGEIISEQIVQIYLSKQGDELFFVIRPKKEEDVKSFCDELDNKIMVWIHMFEFSLSNENISIEKLRYNITLMFLYCTDPTLAASYDMIKDPEEYSLEKSVKVTRKIYIACDNTETVSEKDKAKIPFYFSEYKLAEKESNEEYKKMMGMLPDSADLKFMLTVPESYEWSSDKLEKLAEWLDGKNQ